MTVLTFLIHLRDNVYCIPQSKEGAGIGLPSNGELRRWIAKGMVRLNGTMARQPSEEIKFPVTELIFFPKNEKQRCTLI